MGFLVPPGEAVVWRTVDDFSTMDPVISDGQQSRAVALAFSDSDVYYGTDIPDEQNTIRKHNRETALQTSLMDVVGPVYFAACVRGRCFFSTAVESTNSSMARESIIYASSDWHNWVEALRLKKDWLHPVFFQYGQARFANGPGDGKSIWVSPYGTAYDQESIKLAWLD